ncbi:hypothetical protein BH10BAC2_BH10BAC2_39780 [soil metagenome]
MNLYEYLQAYTARPVMNGLKKSKRTFYLIWVLQMVPLLYVVRVTALMNVNTIGGLPIINGLAWNRRMHMKA